MTKSQQRKRGSTASQWGACAWLGSIALLLCLAAMQAAAQNAPFPGSGTIPSAQVQNPMDPQLGPDPTNEQLRAKRLQALNADRQKSLVADTNKLVKLAAQLNAEINGAHPGSLTDEQLKMVAEIEKLAHSIREKMCLPIYGYPQPQPIPAMVPSGMN